MSVLWAESCCEALFTVKEGERRLDWHLNRPLEWFIEHQAFAVPSRTNFYNAVALTICGYPAEARLCLQKAEALIHAALQHEQDRGTWKFMYDRVDMHTYLYASEWMLRGKENLPHLKNAIVAVEEAIRRSLAEGLDAGPEAYRDLTLCRLILGEGEAALMAAVNMAERPLPTEPEGLAKGKPTKVRTLALAAHSLINPDALPREHYRQAIDRGILAVLKEEVAHHVGHPDELFLWLRLREQIFEHTPDPWEMLRSLPVVVNA